MKKVLSLVLILVLVMASVAYGAGFALYEWSARGNALGGTLVGRADDPSAVAYNPAGITQLKGTHALAGMTAIAPDVSVEIDGQGKTSTKNNWYFPLHAYVVTQLNDRYWLGIGEYTRFGLGTDFPSNWPGRFNAYFAEIKSYSIAPCLAMKLTDKLSLAFGLEGMYFDFTKKKKTDLTPIPSEMDTKIHGDSFGYGFNVSLHYVPFDWLKIGFVYRSQIEQSLKGRATFEKPAVTPATYFNDTGVSGDITLPDSYTLGIVVYPNKKLSFEADVVYTRWSSYDKLVITYDDDLMPPNNITQTVSKKDWKDVWRFQLGLEYQVDPHWTARVSYIYDQTPIPDEHIDYMLPANNRHLFGVGAGYKMGQWQLDFSYNYLIYENRDVDRNSDGVLPGSITDGRAHLIGISLGYSF
ncbi:MAG: OmpP1/FadL family transporter [Desulfonauticus sp.]|nr:OmpP1/FadL family transporter [Desulfonauticus sp.]